MGNDTLAIIPKARGMYARHMTVAEYEELMRRRTVPEVAFQMKRHPYFKDSLASLSTAEPHRSQIEELLDMDIFAKYETLTRYNFSGSGFYSYFLEECELREVMKALQLLSIGRPFAYHRQMPNYLVGKTRVYLPVLGDAANFGEVLELCRHAPYYKALRAQWLADPELTNYPAAEAAMVRHMYEAIFTHIQENLSGTEAKSVRKLFLQQIEIYNLGLLMRVKTYFPKVFRPEEVHRLLVPYTYRLNRQTMDELENAKTPEELYALYRQSALARGTVPAMQEDMSIAGTRAVYHSARRLLHLTTSPAAAVAAFITLARLERENAVNVIEGVRYGLMPEKMRAMLKY